MFISFGCMLRKQDKTSRGLSTEQQETEWQTIHYIQPQVSRSLSATVRVPSMEISSRISHHHRRCHPSNTGWTLVIRDWTVVSTMSSRELPTPQVSINHSQKSVIHRQLFAEVTSYFHI